MTRSNKSEKYRCAHCPNCSHLKARMFNQFKCSLYNVTISSEGQCNMFLSHSKVSDHFEEIHLAEVANHKTQLVREKDRDEEVLKMPLEQGVRVTRSRALNSSISDGYSFGFFAALVVATPLGLLYSNISDPHPRYGIVFLSIVAAAFWVGNKYSYKKAINEKVMDYLEKRKAQGDDVSEYDERRVRFEVDDLVDDYVHSVQGKNQSKTERTYSDTGVCPNCAFLNDPRETHCQKCGKLLSS